MSLNKTLDRLFDEIRREAKRNPDFANRLDAVLQLHDSRRGVPEGVVEEIASANASSSPASGGGGERSEPEGRVASAETPSPQPITAPAKTKKGEPAPDINPAGLYKREGEAALSAALHGQKLTALRALVTEHNLDPSGVTSTLTRDELAAHIVDQAKRRAERDEKMFDY
jgi:hypothetical protein